MSQSSNNLKQVSCTWVQRTQMGSTVIKSQSSWPLWDVVQWEICFMNVQPTYLQQPCDASCQYWEFSLAPRRINTALKAKGGPAQCLQVYLIKCQMSVFYTVMQSWFIQPKNKQKKFQKQLNVQSLQDVTTCSLIKNSHLYKKCTHKNIHGQLHTLWMNEDTQ